MDRRNKIIGIVALAYTITWLLILLFNLNFFTNGFINRLPWLYRVTSHMSYILIFWLIVFGITRFVGRQSWLGRFVDNNVVMGSLTLYSTMLFVYGVVSTGAGYSPMFSSEFRFWAIASNILTYFGAFILMWTLFLLNERKAPQLWSIFVMLIYPVVYFIVNMIVGHTVKWAHKLGVLPEKPSAFCPDCLPPATDGYPAFAYPFLNPAIYSHIGFFILAMIGALCFLVLVAFTLIKIKQKQINDLHKRSK